MKNTVLIMAALCLLLPLHVMAADEDGEAVAPVTVYHELKPALVVNLKGKKRYLRAEVQLMAKGRDVIDEVIQHEPAIRHELLLMYSDLVFRDISTVEGQNRLRQDTLQVVQDLLRDLTGRPGIKAIYFTKFLTQ